MAKSRHCARSYGYPPWAGWDSGTLNVTFKNRQGLDKKVSVRFAGISHRQLDSLEVTTSDWVADISDEVHMLTWPVPNRIVFLATFDSNGNFRAVDLTLPYQVGELTLLKCRAIELLVEKGGSVTKNDHEADSGLCDQ